MVVKGRAHRVSIYQLFMLALCVYVLAALVVDTFFQLDENIAQILAVVDTGICVIFIVDFVYNLSTQGWKYLKWGWIDLVSSIPMVGPLRFGRAIRVFRIVRLLRGVRSVKVLSGHLLKHRAQSAFATAAMISILLVVFGSVAILQVEKGMDNNIQNAEDALWWSFVTMTTVGYGDKYPVTTEGRLIAALLMVGGIGLFGTFTGFVANWFMKGDKRHRDREMDRLRSELAAIKNLLADKAQKQT